MAGLKLLLNLPEIVIKDEHAYITLVPDDGKRLKFRYGVTNGLQWKTRGGEFLPVFHSWDTELWSDINHAIEDIQGDWEKRKEWAKKLQDILKQRLEEEK